MNSTIELDLNEFKNKKIAVAFSGGRDSVVLLHLMKKTSVDFFAVNIEHGIRGKSSIEDSEFCKKLCQEWNIPIKTFNVDSVKYAKKNKITIEQAARVLRYQVFDNLIASKQCDFIALAHHADDQVETILMHILRGTGISGLEGMSKVNNHYIRPLLEVTRDDIDAYVKENSLQYVEDETNSDTKYTRNFLRQEIKRIKEKYPDLIKSFLRLQRNATEVNAFINKYVPDFEIKGNERFINTSNMYDNILIKRAIENAINDLGVYQDIEEKHYNLMLDLLSHQNGDMLNLTHNLICVKEQSGLTLYLDNKNSKKINMDFSIENLNKIGYKANIVDAFKKNDKDALYLDLDKLNESVIRNREDFDSINKFGGGSKSLGDFLTDNKVPKRNRDDIIVIAKDSEILCILGYEISSTVKITNNTKKILKIDKLK